MIHMGEVDVEILHDILETTKTLEKENNWGFKFRTDNGKFETAIEFTAIGYHHPPKSNSWEEAKSEQNEIKCPDLLDFHNRIILEYEEEEGRPKSGAYLAKKGHNELSDSDQHRDHLYRIGGFRYFKIWESAYKDGSYKKKLWKFLCDCFCNRKNKKGLGVLVLIRSICGTMF